MSSQNSRSSPLVSKVLGSRRTTMPASTKRKEERAKKARDDRRLAILHFPSAFGNKISLDAHVDLLQSLINDATDYENLDYLRETIKVYDSALGILIKRLCSAAETKRILDNLTTSAARDSAWTYMTTHLQTSIDSAYNIAGLLHMEKSTCFMHVAYGNTALSKVPEEVPMLDFFRETQTAYEELKEALAEHTELCESMDEDYASGTLNEVEVAVLTENLEWVWRCRAIQLVHATVKARFEELAVKFFEDKDAHKEAIQVLDEFEEGFEEPWKYVMTSEGLVRPGQDFSIADFEASSGSGVVTPKGEVAEDGEHLEGGGDAQG
ncbi:uncharacterized protein N0V89_010711 [Didymosphaeria variabile]|uniref:Uncharacterized protein n=1 Tax=Didymosphaeria variabile TaxID=1932322 RepID=A0A9W8XBS2_9PLEO|nr:uncharacterized protein N0V89_010711 [Didymosphaeria variabile]KAJ4346779.1 hypothetical protein N0V89_010711 [Didymosphaeria variabile]